MNEKSIRSLLESVRSGNVSVEDAIETLRRLPFEDIGWACIDHHRQLREGFPEVIYGPGKTPKQLVEIIKRLMETGGPLLVTRVSRRQADYVLDRLPMIEYHPDARAMSWVSPKDHAEKKALSNDILVIAAGTADMPIAREACLTLRLMGQGYKELFDVGVAGVHRLLGRLDMLAAAKVIIAIAGMDGALPSLIGGLSSVPVIAVPTSTGYGANFNGVAPLLTMLNSCSTGVAVVNIDNGFGAAVLAAMISKGAVGPCQSS